MEKCVRCGAETILFVAGVPLCVDCDSDVDKAQLPNRPRKAASEPERKDKPVIEFRKLSALYAQSAADYGERVKALTKAAGSAELDAFTHLWDRCETSRVACAQLRRALQPYGKSQINGFSDPMSGHCRAAAD
jgi:hypothetical protein